MEQHQECITPSVEPSVPSHSEATSQTTDENMGLISPTGRSPETDATLNEVDINSDTKEKSTEDLLGIGDTNGTPEIMCNQNKSGTKKGDNINTVQNCINLEPWQVTAGPSQVFCNSDVQVAAETSDTITGNRHCHCTKCHWSPDEKLSSRLDSVEQLLHQILSAKWEQSSDTRSHYYCSVSTQTMSNDVERLSTCTQTHDYLQKEIDAIRKQTQENYQFDLIQYKHKAKAEVGSLRVQNEALSLQISILSKKLDRCTEHRKLYESERDKFTEINKDLRNKLQTVQDELISVSMTIGSLENSNIKWKEVINEQKESKKAECKPVYVAGNRNILSNFYPDSINIYGRHFKTRIQLPKSHISQQRASIRANKEGNTCRKSKTFGIYD